MEYEVKEISIEKAQSYLNEMQGWEVVSTHGKPGMVGYSLIIILKRVKPVVVKPISPVKSIKK